MTCLALADTVRDTLTMRLVGALVGTTWSDLWPDQCMVKTNPSDLLADV